MSLTRKLNHSDHIKLAKEMQISDFLVDKYAKLFYLKKLKNF